MHGAMHASMNGVAPRPASDMIPLMEATAPAFETYPGGRYLELDRTATGIYDLDFNRAYHPFCYYNPKYDCPYPPRENRLTTPIRAGEKMGTPPH